MYISWAVAGICTAIACFLSFQLVREHKKNWNNPEQQQYALYIIYMVPLFAVNSFIGLLDMEASETVVMLLDSIKECYEAWVLHSFLQLMFSYLKLDINKPVPDSLKGRHIHQSFPFSLFMKDMKLDNTTVKRLFTWTQQFIILRPIVSVIDLVLEVTGYLDKFSLWITIVLNVSVTLAVYALMLVYHAFEHELKDRRPLAKFLSIKMVVFFAFWQGAIVQILVYTKVIHENHWYSVEEIEVGIQNFLVCMEAGLLFSFAHNYAFSADEFKVKPEDSKKDK